MGTKTIVFCDLCKQEAEEDKFNTLTFKKPGKTGHKYEICRMCAAKMQQQLVGEDELSEGWEFGSEIPQGNTPPVTQPSESAAERRTRLLGEQGEDDKFVAEKQREVQRAESPPTKTRAKGKKGCLHYNRTSPQVLKVDGEEIFAQECKDCKKILKPKGSKERQTISKGGK